MANEQVVDELVVKLTLDDSQYKQADKAKNKLIDGTEKKERSADAARDKRNKNRKKSDVDEKRSEGDRQKRLGQTEKAVKQLGSTLKVFALTTAAVFGIGAGVGGIVNAITNLAGFETGLRRAAVSTGMSNREMQAWGATAKRLGADADSGAAAIAALAREQKQFNITGAGPTMQALQRMGVNITPNTKPEDALEQAQAIYKRAPPAQQQQMEAQLSAQGVSDDLIVMIKQGTDVLETYNRSLADSTEENKASMAALNDAFTSLKQASIALGGVLATVATPYIKEFGDWVHSIASDPHQIDAWISKTSAAFTELVKDAGILADGMKAAWATVNDIAHPVNQASHAVAGFFAGTANSIHAANPDNKGTPGALMLRRMLHSMGIGDNPDINGLSAPRSSYADSLTDTPVAPGSGNAPGSTGSVSVSDFAQMLTQRGMTPAQAAAAAANAAREAGDGHGGINPAALNPSGGASGVFQWLGPRKDAFHAQYGVDPNQAPLSQQLDFLFNNPAEKARMQKAFAGGGDAQALGTRWSQLFEAHGNQAEDIKRGQLAGQLAGGPNAPSGTPTDATTQINLNGPITVKADNPGDFVSGITRIASVQNYQSANR